MTVTSMVPEPSDARTTLLDAGVESNAATPPPASPSSTSRLDEVTVKDLVLAAGRMGCSPSVVAPPLWATRTDIDEENLSVLHRHEFKSGKVGVGLESLIRKINFGTDATLWWDSCDPTGASEVKSFSVMIDDIPAIIAALQAAYEVAQTSPREIRRSAEVEEMLREREA